jgi:hypothetical protein
VAHLSGVPHGSDYWNRAGTRVITRRAEQYLSSEGFSRQGLITQLASIDGFSTEDATAAVNSISVNWNGQAARSAKQYLSSEGFSHSGLVTQLVSIDGYTPAQAEYGVNAVGL